MREEKEEEESRLKSGDRNRRKRKERGRERVDKEKSSAITDTLAKNREPLPAVGCVSALPTLGTQHAFSLVQSKSQQSDHAAPTSPATSGFPAGRSQSIKKPSEQWQLSSSKEAQQQPPLPVAAPVRTVPQPSNPVPPKHGNHKTTSVPTCPTAREPSQMPGASPQSLPRVEKASHPLPKVAAALRTEPPLLPVSSKSLPQTVGKTGETLLSGGQKAASQPKIHKSTIDQLESKPSTPSSTNTKHKLANSSSSSKSKSTTTSINSQRAGHGCSSSSSSQAVQISNPLGSHSRHESQHGTTKADSGKPHQQASSLSQKPTKAVLPSTNTGATKVAEGGGTATSIEILEEGCSHSNNNSAASSPHSSSSPHHSEVNAIT